MTKSNSRPIVWPLLGPDGVKMTRDYPMVPESVGEAHDHPHHRSFWFTHGEVNGVDFWAETPNHGTVEHQAFTVLSEGEHAIVAANNIWKKPDGTPVLTERRRLTFGGTADVRWMDCEFVLAAEHGEVHFGDTKEGSFALRVAESMKVDAKLGGKILNSRGDENQKAWGQPAEWVDYVGPIDDATYGIAIFCHPTTFHYPNRWHVRTYGLFAANPFGVYHFTGDKEPTAGVVLESGEELTFRYRILLHRGDTESAEIAEHFAKFAQQEFEKL
ncbi:MAG: PmoA family protein [Planctomycetales bacterium]|nr:PmoA family protein [Planctomycetales bacterium]